MYIYVFHLHQHNTITTAISTCPRQLNQAAQQPQLVQVLHVIALPLNNKVIFNYFCCIAVK